MELTLKYYHYFGSDEKRLGGNLNNPDSWDVLRMKKGSGNPYYIPEDREAWQKICLSNECLNLRARRIVELLKPRFNHIHSFGVGAACLEFLIKKEDPSFQLRCSDFTPQGIERLKGVFVEADEISHFDMIHGDWSTISDEQWRKVFDKMKCAGITDVLFIPCGVFTFRKILHQQLKYICFKLLRRKMTFSGFVRTEKKFISLLSEFYDIDQIVQIHDLKGFLLTSKEKCNENR